MSIECLVSFEVLNSLLLLLLFFFLAIKEGEEVELQTYVGIIILIVIDDCNVWAANSRHF
jgi:hypothetical protein